MKGFLVGFLRWAVALAMPIFLLLTASRLTIGDWFLRSEYAKADFPRDRYGWTQAQRLELGLPSIHFLNSPLPAEQAVKILADEMHPGTQTRLFSGNELSHMVDVKRLVDQLWRVHLFAAIVVIGGLVLLLLRPVTRPSAFLALTWGGVLTAGLLLLLAVFVVTGFDTFFVQFHELFFPQGNWTFDYTDSLIRLFPEKLWFDAGFLISGGTLVSGLIVGGLGYLLWRGSAGARGAVQAGKPVGAKA